MARIKFNPIVRAVAVIASVAALATGTTFALLQSNTVSLQPNTLSAATAALRIGGDNGTSCATSSDTSVPGFTSVKLVPGVESATLPFCLKNTGDIPLAITSSVTGSNVAGQIPFNEVTLKVTCTGGPIVTDTLDAFTNKAILSSLNNGSSVDCSATATLSNSYDPVTDGTTVPSFSINFVGNQLPPS